jgi:hypothetical protein
LSIGIIDELEATSFHRSYGITALLWYENLPSQSL